MRQEGDGNFLCGAMQPACQKLAGLYGDNPVTKLFIHRFRLLHFIFMFGGIGDEHMAFMHEYINKRKPFHIRYCRVPPIRLQCRPTYLTPPRPSIFQFNS